MHIINMRIKIFKNQLYRLFVGIDKRARKVCPDRIPTVPYNIEWMTNTVYTDTDIA